MAERVDQRGALIKAQLRRVPTPAWFALLIAGAVVVAALVQLAGGDHTKVQPQLVSFPTGATDTALPVRYRVSTPAHTEVRCRIDALGKDHDVVGTLMDTVPARSDDGRSTTRTIVVATTKPAVSADINSCVVVHAS